MRARRIGYRNFKPSVPSARNSKIAPADPNIAIDIENSLSERGYAPVGNALRLGWSVTTYDARPANTEDFVFSGTQAELAAFVGNANGSIRYNVPQGKIAVLRNVKLKYWTSGAPRGASGAPAVQVVSRLTNAAGDPVNWGALNSDGLRVDGYVSATTFDVEADLDTYLLFPEDNAIIFSLQILNAFTFTGVQFALSGQLLTAKGLELSEEPLTYQPLPVMQTRLRNNGQS